VQLEEKFLKIILCCGTKKEKHQQPTYVWHDVGHPGLQSPLKTPTINL